MQIHTVLFAVSAALLGAGIYMHRQNSVLEQMLQAESQRCEQYLADLNNKHREEIDDLRWQLRQRPATSGAKSESRLKPDPEPEKPRFSRFVSHGHKIRAIHQKYDFILETARISEEEKESLRRLLLERERIADLLAAAGADSSGTGSDEEQLQSDLDEIEAKIQVLLQDPLDYYRYTVLRQREL